MLYISTDCQDDLSALTSDLVRFEKPSGENRSPFPQTLKHEHNWFVGSEAGCSCTFRHLCRGSVELGFCEPEDWFPEEPAAIEATRRLYAILKDMVQRGHNLELLDCWIGDEDEGEDEDEDKGTVVLDVSLSQVPADCFRVFEGHLFSLKS